MGAGTVGIAAADDTPAASRLVAAGFQVRPGEDRLTGVHR